MQNNDNLVVFTILNASHLEIFISATVFKIISFDRHSDFPNTLIYIVTESKFKMSNNYFCCGVPTNPWEDVFGNGATQPIAQEQPKTVDWDNPFDLAAPQPVSYTQEDARSMGSGSYDRSVADVRSIGSHSRDSSFGNKSLKEMQRENNAAMFLEKGGLTRSPYEKTFVNKEAMSTKRKLFHLIKRTETTRAKKELTAEDVRDPDTIPGMKLQSDIDKEEKAKNSATLMISSGRFPHDKKAGTAFYTLEQRQKQVRRTDGKINAIV